MADYKNILIIQTAFIGDAILASSLLEKLHMSHPDAKLSILVRKGNEGVYANHPYLKEVLVWNKQENKLKNLYSLIKQVRNASYDCVINCHRFASSGLIAVCSRAIHISGYKQNPFSFLFNYTVKHKIGNGVHEVERYNLLVQDVAPGASALPKLYPSKTDYEFIKSYQTNNYVCIAPASVWFTKQLPAHKWVELCNQLPPEQTIYLLGATGDNKLCEQIKKEVLHPRVEILAGRLNLLQSCALMKFASMNYVNDSAPLHLASSVNAPVTAFFLSTVPEFGFGPLSQKASVIETKHLACRPCGLHGHKHCPQKHFNCAEKINFQAEIEK